MIITFKKIRYKNILSTGNFFNEILLNKSKTTLISGSNGSGKCVRGSTEIDIKFKSEETEKLFSEFCKKKY
jgi:hypothetical protein